MGMIGKPKREIFIPLPTTEPVPAPITPPEPVTRPEPVPTGG